MPESDFQVGKNVIVKHIVFLGCTISFTILNALQQPWEVTVYHIHICYENKVLTLVFNCST